MSKNIVVLSDGTGQEGGKGHDTNVYKLLRMLEDRTERQIVFYDQGIGTEGRKFSSNVGGAGFSKNILQCYQFIYENYFAGDKIYLFGFSRGAATVRSLANFIHFFGILPKSRPELIERAYAIYKTGSKKKGTESLNEEADKFVRQHPNQWASIEFLGVWDTVPALGLPGVVIDTIINLIPQWKHRYHDFTLHPSVRNAYHALSIDDDRKWFHPTIWEACNTDYQKVEQVWFSGSHTDVGGGFREPGLSDITLEWMVQKAVAHGIKLHLRTKKYWNFCIAPDPTDIWHPPRTGTRKIYPGMKRVWSENAQKTFGVPVIHASVLDRAMRVEGYEPWIINEFPEHKVEPWNAIFEYEGKTMSIRDYDEAMGKVNLELNEGEIKILKPDDDRDKLLERGKWSDNRLERDLKRWKENTLRQIS